MSILSVDNEQGIITISGNLTKSTVVEQSSVTINLAGDNNYSMDLSKLDKFDSAGLAYLVNLISKQQKKGFDIKLINCSEQVQQLIELSELDEVISTQSV